MSGIGNWLWGTSQLDDAVDKATSELLPAGAEDIALNLEICDQIRSKSVPAKDAMRALKRRLNHKNPNVQNLALGLTDICIKNGGDQFLAEISSREFMDNIVSILKIPALNIEVKNNILRLVQNWSIAFEGKPVLSYVGQVYKNLTNEGFKFPPKDLAIANSAMVDTQTAPEWIDSDVCLRCRTAFSFTNRKHHCRNCGQVFDQACSSKSMPLPHFGITQEVRVCEGCYSKLTRKGDKVDKGRRHSTSLHGARHRNARELADIELQRAIQLSLQEVGAANGHARPGYVPSQPSPSNWQYSEPPIVDRSSHPDTKYPLADEEDDPDLKAAIEASLREASAPKPSAPVALDSPRTEQPSYSYAGPGYSQSYPPSVAPALPAIPNYDLEPLESDAILTFSQTIEQVEAQGGRDISRYPAVNELYDKASSLRPKLALSLDDAGRKEQMLSDMHDKLSQAVKLYDKLLTEQVAHPRWRSPQAVTTPPVPASYQQANSSYSTGYNTVNGYTQWTSPAPATVGYQAPPEMQREPQSPQMAYNPAPPAQEYHIKYSQPHAESSQSQLQWQQQQPQYAQPGLQYSPTPVPAPPTIVPTQAPPEPQRQSSYAEPAQYHQYVVSPPPQSQGLPPVSLPLHQYQHAILSSQPAPAPVPSAPQSPPVQYAASPLSQSGTMLPPSSLSRNKTVSYASSPPPPPANTHLGRSNTVVHQHRQQAQQQQHVPPPAPLPHFPVVPTSAPQSFSMYAPSIPTGIAQTEERKEALLIDL